MYSFCPRGAIKAIRLHYSPTSFLKKHQYHGSAPRLAAGQWNASFKSSAQETLSSIRADLMDAVKEQDTFSISDSYKHLKRVLQSFPPIRKGHSAYKALSREDIDAILDGLSSADEPAHASLAREIVQDCEKIFGFTVSRTYASKALNALVNSAIGREGHSVPEELAELSLSREEWRLGMRDFAQKGRTEEIQRAIVLMRQKSPHTPGAEEFCILLRAFRLHPAKVQKADIIRILDDMKQQGVPYHAVLVDILRELDALLEGEDDGLMDAYGERFPRTIGPTQVAAWLGILKHALQQPRQRARGTFLTKLQDIKSQGFVPDERTLAYLVGASASIEHLQFLETALRVKANKIAWSILLKNAVEQRGLDIALSYYQAAKDAGIQPDSAMVHPLLRALCNSITPKATVLDTALSVYRDLCDLSTTGKNDTPPEGPDTPIYNTLLRAFTSAPDKEKYGPVAMALLSDMVDRHVKLDSMTLTSMAVLLIRNARDYSNAFQMYEKVHDLKRGALDGKAYTAVLRAFCSLDFGPHSYPPARQYFKIVQDMRRAGFYMTPEVYTILLNRYAKTGTDLLVFNPHTSRPTRESGGVHGVQIQFLRAALQAAIRRLHRALNLDATLTPDTALWNQLMDTYNRAGAFADSYQIYEQLVLARKHDNTSVSVILDTCGFAGAARHAAAIFSRLLDSGFELNRRNWNSWVECLCRLGKVEEAMKVVCLEMPRQKESCRPDVHTLEILMKFALSSNQHAEVEEKVRRYLPVLWEELRSTLKV